MKEDLRAEQRLMVVLLCYMIGTSMRKCKGSNSKALTEELVSKLISQT